MLRAAMRYRPRMQRTLYAISLVILASACGSSAPAPAAAPATTNATSGHETGCTEIDPWAPRGQEVTPCAQASASPQTQPQQQQQPVIDPFAH
jgi:outer membrane biogenesis lipoprotein LolB